MGIGHQEIVSKGERILIMDSVTGNRILPTIDHRGVRGLAYGFLKKLVESFYLKRV